MPIDQLARGLTALPVTRCTMRVLAALAATGLLLCGMAQMSAAAKDTDAAVAGGTLAIELNAANQQQSACRLSFLVKNGMQLKLSSLVIELVLFGHDGTLLRLMSASVGAMPVSKTRLKQYDVQDLACDRIGRILLNEVTSCEGEKLTPEICTSAARTSSRSKIPLEF